RAAARMFAAVLAAVRDADALRAAREARLLEIAVRVGEAHRLLPAPLAEGTGHEVPVVADAAYVRGATQQAVEDPRLAGGADRDLRHAAVGDQVSLRGRDLLARIPGRAD